MPSNNHQPAYQKVAAAIKKGGLTPYQVIMPNMEVSSSELANLLGVNNTTIYLYIREGMPQITKNKFNAYDCLQWYIGTLKNRMSAAQENYEYEQEKARKTKLEADMKQIELDIIQGRAVTVEDVVSRVSHVLVKIKNIVLNIPGKVSPKLVGKNLKEIKLTLQDEQREALNEILNFEFYEEPKTKPKPRAKKKPTTKKKVKNEKASTDKK